MKFYPWIKRILDFLLSLIAIIILLPVFFIIAVIIKLDSDGPVIFKQERVGKNKKHFYIYKFRTMLVDAPHSVPTYMLHNSHSYITRVGYLLRQTSLDELPQIINVLKGEMSIVGPRPVIPQESDLIEERDKYGANDIYPGITGWAQINGRDTVSIADKARLDGEYVQNMSFWMDIKCLFITIVKVLRRDGIVEGGTVIEENKEIVVATGEQFMSR